MNKRINIIFLILVWFILNIFFFMFSDNYRYFLQSLKYDWSEVYKIDDRFNIKINNLSEDFIKEENIENDNLFSWLSNNFWEDKKVVKKIENNEKIIKKENNEVIENIDNNKVEFVNSRENLKLTQVENDILDELKKYNLKKVDLNTRLFDLTWEYPDEYFEYYSDEINLYFFWNKLYSDLKDIFEVLTYELPFSVNEVNNFWSNSFYINLNAWFEDEYIRIVLKKSNRIIWFKIKKVLYEKIKNELWVIFHK